MFLHFIAFLSLNIIVFASIYDNEIDNCNVSTNLKKEIASYGTVVEEIITTLTKGKYKNSTYNHLAEFVDKFGNRIAGSKNLENAIDFMLNKSVTYRLENVHGEEVNVTHWIRGNESAWLIKPRFQNLAMLGLGGSIGTPAEGIIAEAIVVDSFEELDAVNTKVNGKIVVFNEKYINYGVTVKYRSYSAAKAAKYGAVATLIRSVTPFSLNTPHTGWQDYDDNTKKIPTACITAEDAHMLRRMQKRGDKIVIKLQMDAKNLPSAISRNTVVEIEGSVYPKKVVVVSGHIDSWDVGQGAMDDGGGFMMSWNALAILKSLNLKPKRTLRAILWTAEEEGILGAAAYVKNHQDEIKNLDFVMESDGGTFSPIGLEYAGNDDGACIMKEILKLFASLNTTELRRTNDIAPDVTLWIEEGIPAGSLYNHNENYFWYHHSAADTMDVQDADNLDKNTAIWAATAYVIADLSVDMPRDKNT